MGDGNIAVTQKGRATRDRILEATAELLQRKGYTGTGVNEIIAASQTPSGSLYHYFPGGKEELGAGAIRQAGKIYLSLIAAFFDDATDLVAATASFFEGAAQVLQQTDYADACPIATVALEVASTSEPMREATHEVFESWIEDVTGRLESAGVPSRSARETAIEALALLEGAFILSRASKDTEAVEIAGRRAVKVVREALSGRGRRSRPRRR